VGGGCQRPHHRRLSAARQVASCRCSLRPWAKTRGKARTRGGSGRRHDCTVACDAGGPNDINERAPWPHEPSQHCAPTAADRTDGLGPGLAALGRGNESSAAQPQNAGRPSYGVRRAHKAQAEDLSQRLQELQRGPPGRAAPLAPQVALGAPPTCQSPRMIFHGFRQEF